VVPRHLALYHSAEQHRTKQLKNTIFLKTTWVVI